MTPSEPETVEAAREEVMHNTPERWKHLQRGRLDAFEAAVRRDERTAFEHRLDEAREIIAGLEAIAAELGRYVPRAEKA